MEVMCLILRDRPKLGIRDIYWVWCIEMTIYLSKLIQFQKNIKILKLLKLILSESFFWDCRMFPANLQRPISLFFCRPTRLLSCRVIADRDPASCFFFNNRPADLFFGGTAASHPKSFAGHPFFFTLACFLAGQSPAVDQDFFGTTQGSRSVDDRLFFCGVTAGIPPATTSFYGADLWESVNMSFSY